MSTDAISPCNTFVVDIGDVLYTWSPDTPTLISSHTLKAILTSATWALYERGKLSEFDAYQRASTEHGVDVSDVARAIKHARGSLKPNTALVSFIRLLKDTSSNTLRVCAMSNISQPDYEFLREQNSIDWSIFDHVFTSAAAGMRKPDLGFFKHVISETGCDPSTTVFIDDKAENILSARSLGMHGIMYSNLEQVRTALRRYMGDPVQRGHDFLQRGAGKHVSMTETGVIVKEVFSQLLMLEVTQDRNLADLTGIPEHCGKVNFFQDVTSPATTGFPVDLDTTALALTILSPKNETVEATMDEMLGNCNEDGIILTYFDASRARMDPVVCTNVLALFFAHNRGGDPRLAPTSDWVLGVLKHRAYLDGTRYYKAPEAFLYFITRLLTIAPEVPTLLRGHLPERLRERIGAPGDAITLAMRVIACARMGIRDVADLQQLLKMQHEDGSWGPGELYRFGSSGLNVGNSGLATALALKAIEMIDM